MKKTILIQLLFLPLFANAQDISEILFSGKSVDYFGQLTDKGKDKEGLGIQKLKGGNLFAGNLRKNKFHGLGMMIAGEKGKITNCNGAYVFVGEWENGIKNGKGIVYDKNGAAIYEGMFADDTPTEKYPSEEKTAKHFSYLELEDDEEKELYIGEVENGKPNGFGMTFDEEGFISLSQYKVGKQTGIEIMIFPPDYWATFRVKDERYYPISSSHEQIERQANNKTIAAHERAELMQSLGKVLNAGAELAGTIRQIKDGGSSSDTAPTSGIGIDVTDIHNVSNGENGTHTSSPSNHSSSKKINSTDTKGSQMSMTDQVNYNSLRNTYNKWAQDLMEMKNANGKYQNGFKVSDKKYAQDKMKQIRKMSMQKWNKEIPYNSIEDW